MELILQIQKGVLPYTNLLVFELFDNMYPLNERKILELPEPTVNE